MVKIRITKRGIFGADGPIPVGFEMTCLREPKCWAGKYEVISETEGKDAVTNDDDLAELKARAKELGIEFGPRIGAETLAARIAEAEAE